MIQRINLSIYCWPAIIAVVVVFIPIGYIYTVDASLVFTSFVLKEDIPNGAVKMQTLYIAIMLFVSAALSIYALFNYKNRRKQTKINNFNMIILFVVLVLMLYIFPDVLFAREGYILNPEEFKFNYWIMMGVLPPFFIFLANRAIKKDEKLVRSADRLR